MHSPSLGKRKGPRFQALLLLIIREGGWRVHEQTLIGPAVQTSTFASLCSGARSCRRDSLGFERDHDAESGVDFPIEVLAGFDIEAQHPDNFVL